MELAELLSHKHLLEQIKYGDLDGIVCDITGGKGQSEVDTFKNVGKLKAGADDFDKCYICRAHRDGGNSQGGTRHSLPLAMRRGGFNSNDQLNSSTER